MKPAHRLTIPALGTWRFKCPVYVRFEHLHHGRLIKVRAVRDLSPRQQLIANPKNCFDVVIAEIDVTNLSVTWYDFEAEEHAWCDSDVMDVLLSYVNSGNVYRSSEELSVCVDDMEWLYEIVE